MSRVFFSSMLAMLLLAGVSAEAKMVQARITVGTKTSDGIIISRSDDLITFRAPAMSGNISYPADAIKAVVFPVEVKADAVNKLRESRNYEQLIILLESALKPFQDYSDLPSNLAQYQNLLMELYYRINDYDKTLSYASQLSKVDHFPELQRNAIIYQGLSLIGADRIPEAEALFDAQGWNSDMPDDAPAEDLYITAKFLSMKKDYIKAMETVSKVIAFHSQDQDWMQPAELLCAQIYTDMAEANKDRVYLDSADEVIRQITLLYKDSDEAEQAQKLKRRVDGLRADMALDER